MLLGLVVGSFAGAATPRHAELKVTRMVPLTVHGIGFRRHEVVRVVVRTVGVSVPRNATASADGVFDTSFAGIHVGHCGGFSVTAAGTRGSRASVSVRRHLGLATCNPG